MFPTRAVVAAFAALVVLGCSSEQDESGSPSENFEPRLALVVGAEQSAIWTALPNGSDRRQVVGPEDLEGLGAGEPSWSPDGRFLAFVAGEEKANRSDLYVSERDGSELRRLTDDADLESSPSWSPDGKQIVFVRVTGAGREEAESTLETIGVDGSNRRVLKRLGPGMKNGFFIDADWSSRGTIAVGRIRPVSGRGELAIWLLDADGGNLRRLLKDATAPAWSPDAKSLAFMRPTDRQEPCLGECETQLGMYIAGAGGGAVRRVTTGELQMIDAPAWSPRGDGIVFAGLTRGWDLYVVDARGGAPRSITRTEDWERSPDWTG